MCYLTIHGPEIGTRGLGKSLVCYDAVNGPDACNESVWVGGLMVSRAMPELSLKLIRTALIVISLLTA